MNPLYAACSDEKHQSNPRNDGRNPLKELVDKLDWFPRLIEICKRHTSCFFTVCQQCCKAELMANSGQCDEYTRVLEQCNLFISWPHMLHLTYILPDMVNVFNPFTTNFLCKTWFSYKLYYKPLHIIKLHTNFIKIRVV